MKDNMIKKAAKKAKSILQGFKNETLKKVVTALRAAIDHYKTEIENEKELKVSISAGNVKIGRVMNVSLSPVLTCGAMCKHCIRLCYDLKACLQYINVLLARARNTALALYNRPEYFAQIEKAIARRKKNFYFRWHVGGDIPDADYFDNMVRIAAKYPHFIFWTYTKKIQHCQQLDKRKRRFARQFVCYVFAMENKNRKRRRCSNSISKPL